MRFLKTIVLFIFISASSYAQQGSYYLTQYDLSQQNISHYNFEIVQDNHGLVYLANLKGVVVTDGLEWSLLETPYSIFSLEFDPSNNLYVGGKHEIGVIDLTQPGNKAYQKLDSIHQEITDIAYFKGNIYFMAKSMVIVYNPANQKITRLIQPANQNFLRLVTYKNQLYVVSETAGFLLINNHKISRATPGLPSGTVGIETSEQGQLLAYTSEGEYYLQDTTHKRFAAFKINDKGYLEQNTPVSIKWVNEKLLAIATLNGGVVFVETPTGKVVHYMNYANGLADNEIRTLFVGGNHMVWCATPLGVSIIAPEIPIRNFATYKGLQGKIEVVQPIGNRLFVGTSVGLFELVKNKVYKDIITYNTTTKTEYVEGHVIETRKKGLFKKKKKKQDPVLIARDKKITTRQVQKKLLSENYLYKKIDNIDSKVVQLVVYNNRLIAGTLSGVYEIAGTKAIKIFDEPVVYLYKPDEFDFLMISTYDQQVKVLHKQNGTWSKTGLLDGLNDFVEQIHQDNEGGLWLCGTDSVYRIDIANAQTLEDVEVYHIHNPYWERVYASTYENKIYFLNTSGYYYYQNHRIVKDTLIAKKIGLPQQMILSATNKLWVNTGRFWYGRGKDLNNSLNFISLFEDPRYIAEGLNNSYWLVGGKNQLYYLDGSKISRLTHDFDLFLKVAQKDSLLLAPSKALGKIDQKSLLSFKFTSPDYTNIYQPEYQYRLVGLSNEWSDWSRTNNQLSFPYLPAGTYTLQMRARDALGNVKNAEAIHFTIMAPYWKRWWFYLAEFVFFGGLMALSIFINRKKHKFSVLSRLLTFLTLIFIVEFVQTIAEAKFETNQSPVINFFIQVAIALSILPIESYLRKFILVRNLEKDTNANTPHKDGE